MVGGKGWGYSKRTPWLVWQLGDAVSSKLRSSLVLPAIGQSYHEVLKSLCKTGHTRFSSMHAWFSNVSSFSNQTLSLHARGESQSEFFCSQAAPCSLIIDFRKPQEHLFLLSRTVIPSYPLHELVHSRFAQISLTMMWPQQCSFLVTDVWNAQYPANFQLSERLFVCWLQTEQTWSVSTNIKYSASCSTPALVAFRLATRLKS